MSDQLLSRVTYMMLGNANLLKGVNVEDILLYLHILFAAIWLGGAAISIILLLSIKNLSPGQAKPIIQNVANLGKFVFGPTSILVLITGTGLISVANFSFSDLWISLAFLGVIVNIIFGAVFHVRAGRKALAAAEPDSSETLADAMKNWLLLAYLDLAIIAGVLALMVFKPGV